MGNTDGVFGPILKHLLESMLEGLSQKTIFKTQFCHKINEVYNMPGLSRMKYEAQMLVAKTWSPTKLSILLYRESKHLKEDDKEFLELLFEKLPKIKQMEQLIKDFKQLFLIKKDGMLQKWIQEASTSECGLKNFAKNLLRD